MRGRNEGKVRGITLAMASLLALGCGPEADVPEGPVGEVVRPNYTVRLDSESAVAEEYHLVEDDDGIRIQTGPAGIAYRSDDSMRSGDLRLEATFAQYEAPIGYREAFGLFLGGLDLAGPDLEYTYLLVRTTGDYLIKRRIGEITETLVDWTPHDAVARVVEEGDQPINTLRVEVVGSDVIFSVNGTALESLPVSRVRPYGVAGVRVNHRLDVRVDDWSLEDAELDS